MFGKTKSPWSVLIAGADTVPLDSLISVTVAPGTTPPWTSLTMPDRVPVTPWARAGAAPMDQATTTPSATPRYRVTTFRFDMKLPPSKSEGCGQWPEAEDRSVVATIGTSCHVVNTCVPSEIQLARQLPCCLNLYYTGAAHILRYPPRACPPHLGAGGPEEYETPDLRRGRHGAGARRRRAREK